MAKKDKLRWLEKRRDGLEAEIAEKVSEREKISADIDNKEQRDPVDPVRQAKLDKALHLARVQKRKLTVQIETTRTRRQKVTRKAKRLAKKIRNSISPKVVDLGFDRTAVRPLSRQGTIYGSVGHYTAGPLDDDGDEESFRLWRAYDQAHKNQGWSCLGYNVGITRDGTITRLRGLQWVGAHTLNYNSGRVGISVHGTTGDTWKFVQRRALRKALKKFDLIDKPLIGHWQAPGQATACPGSFLKGYTTKGKSQ